MTNILSANRKVIMVIAAIIMFAFTLLPNPAKASTVIYGGGGDYIQVFTISETQALNRNISIFNSIKGTPTVCDYVYVSRLSRVCSLYKTVLTVEWLQARWFVNRAAASSACAVWVADDAWWRPSKIRPAKDYYNGLAVAWVSVGRPQIIRTADGWRRLSCPG